MVPKEIYFECSKPVEVPPAQEAKGFRIPDPDKLETINSKS
jgi:hypothetical protein